MPDINDPTPEQREAIDKEIARKILLLRAKSAILRDDIRRVLGQMPVPVTEPTISQSRSNRPPQAVQWMPAPSQIQPLRSWGEYIMWEEAQVPPPEF